MSNQGIAGGTGNGFNWYGQASRTHSAMIPPAVNIGIESKRFVVFKIGRLSFMMQRETCISIQPSILVGWDIRQIASSVALLEFVWPHVCQCTREQASNLSCFSVLPIAPWQTGDITITYTWETNPNLKMYGNDFKAWPLKGIHLHSKGKEVWSRCIQSYSLP